MSLDDARAFVARLSHGREDRLVHLAELPPREAVVAPWPAWLPSDVREAYARRGIAAPWSHQVQAAEGLYAGRHVAIATGTASGKSLAFGMPALAAIEAGTRSPDGRGAVVLYLAPTKALANDQLRALDELDLGWLRAATYDGDTVPEERAWVRRHANLVLSNPDLLHHSALPGHEHWATFLRRLRFVVVDEAHTYRGVLGAHVALVLRRLRRLCAHYGSSPTLAIASATLAGPGVSAARLIGGEVEPVTDDCSPHPGAVLGFWQPPLVDALASDEHDAARRSALAESADLLADCVAEGRQTLVFSRSRGGAEAVASMARERLDEVDPELGARVTSYRGGYLPEERRAIEAQLRGGEISGLATTSALEMGIDVAGLDVVITAGWPGTRASLWQQWGRAGRADAAAVDLLVTRDDPLDAYVARHPHLVLDAGVESIAFDPGNPYVLAPHLCAAAAELPLTDAGLVEEFGPVAPRVVADLVRDDLLRRRPAGWFWTRPERASDLADLRGAGATVRIIEEGTGRVLGTVDRASAPATVHPGAVYVHLGVSHVVRSLDLEDAVAVVIEEDVDYTTLARSVSDIAIIDIALERPLGAATLTRGAVDVSAQVVGFQRRLVTGETLGIEPLDLPAARLQTAAVWWTVTADRLGAAGIDAADTPGALHAAEHASIGLLPLFATCDRWDLGGVSTALHPDTALPTVFVYDGYAGGAGFAEHGFAVAEQWLGATRDTIAACPCERGCPSCIHSPKCGNGNEPLDKVRAVSALELVVGGL